MVLLLKTFDGGLQSTRYAPAEPLAGEFQGVAEVLSQRRRRARQQRQQAVAYNLFGRGFAEQFPAGHFLKRRQMQIGHKVR